MVAYAKPSPANLHQHVTFIMLHLQDYRGYMLKLVSIKQAASIYRLVCSLPIKQ